MKPMLVSAYTPKSISSDLVALLDYLKIPQVIVVGHDWGAAIAWRLCAFHPNRVKALVTSVLSFTLPSRSIIELVTTLSCSASVPFNPPAKQYLPPAEVATRAPTLGYMEYFADDMSTQEIEGKLLKFFNLLYRRPPQTLTTNLASSANDEETWYLSGRLRRLLFSGQSSRRTDLLELPEMEVYLRSFSSTWEEKGSGMQGPLSYYRTGQLRVTEERGRQDEKEIHPSSQRQNIRLRPLGYARGA
ncbi:hypothetical protein FRB90_001947 [Tulasnella sp. 427]|nr:hypothetical protein FRB90_001947 [Tulasnella sp. 427]